MTELTEKLARVLAWLAVLVIIILSVLPGNERPHTGASGQFEHIMAYSITSALLIFSGNAPAPIIVGLSLLSGQMEIIQISIPGRHASFADFAASSIGAVIGVVLALAATRYFRRAA